MARCPAPDPPVRRRSRPPFIRPASRWSAGPFASVRRPAPQYSRLTDLCAGADTWAGEAGAVPGARPGRPAEGADAPAPVPYAPPQDPTPTAPRRTRAARPHPPEKWIP